MRRTSERRRRPAIDVRGWLRRVGQQLPWYAPGDTVEARNIRGLYAETAWFGLLSGLAATFVPVYALRLGATTNQVGWLAALPALISVVWLIPAARLIERRRRRMPVIWLTGLLQRLGYLAMALMPSLIPRGQIQVLIVLNLLVTLPTAVVNIGITALIPDLVSPQQRGQVLSVRWLILAVTATLSSLLGGKFLDLFPVPVNYQLLLGIGSLFSMLSLGYLRRIQVPDRALVVRIPRPRQRWSLRPLLQSLEGVLDRRDFVRFAAASFVFYWGIYLPSALWSVLRVRDLGASDSWIGLIAVMVDGSTVMGYLYWGRVRAKRGDRWVLLIASVGVAAYALLTSVVPTMAWMIPTSILGGLTWSGCNLALFNVMLSVCPDGQRASYVALYTALINVTAFAGPLLGAALADGIGIRWAFAISAGVRLAGVLLFLLLFRPRTKD